MHDFIIKIFERDTQLVRVGVFAVHYQYGFLTVIYEVVDIVFYKSTCIRDFTVFREGVAITQPPYSYIITLLYVFVVAWQAPLFQR